MRITANGSYRWAEDTPKYWKKELIIFQITHDSRTWNCVPLPALKQLYLNGEETIRCRFDQMLIGMRLATYRQKIILKSIVSIRQKRTAIGQKQTLL
ncbi:hypothetical protein F506_18970 [Herbaspirillum hiltneri N3]|uniref:Uncharacterized protein n=1 Tax=Herbaspirillum hiltneri N3 TaxID=1262470 RepID=A0ABN4I034_9BURK|nr:hypothetical protein F506_18970 [Herbaspirillum hiltneri N3]